MIRHPHLDLGNRQRFNRRRDTRYGCSATTLCWVIASAGQDHQEAAICNISASGICLVLEARFEPGTVLDVELADPKRGKVLGIRIEVVHADIELPNGTWMHGAAFDRLLSEEELRAFLPAAKSEPVPADWWPPQPAYQG